MNPGELIMAAGRHNANGQFIKSVIVVEKYNYLPSLSTQAFVFPVPSQDYISVWVPSDFDFTNAVYNLLSLESNSLETGDLISAGQLIDIRALNQGYYIIQIKDGKGKFHVNKLLIL